MSDANSQKPAEGKDKPLIPHRWKPGESGNPTGRPKDLKIIKDFAKKNSLNAVRVLIEIMNDVSQKAVSRIAAANGVLDRGYGKPSQEVIVKGTGKDGQIEMSHMAVALSTDELQEYKKMLLKANTALIEGAVSAGLGDSDDMIIDIEPEPSNSEDEDLSGYE